MRPSTSVRRWVTRGSVAAFASVGLAVGVMAGAGSAQASAGHHSAVVNPYSPAYHHSYRHGAVPTIAQQGKMNAWSAAHHSKASLLAFGGGIDGIGVTDGTEKVYLVFYSGKWGTETPSGCNGLTSTCTFSGDAKGMAPRLQEFFKGLGTNSEAWSTVMTQYCQGVSVGATSCPSTNTQHVAYPTGGATLAGVWYDSRKEPFTASGHNLGVQAVSAAAHFGNTTAASNRDAQYVIVSGTGKNPDGWLTNGFCAWHDYNGDTTLSGGAVTSPYGDISFTNLPYIPDAGSSCGQNFVNSNGPLDGVTIVEGHEYAETITDQNPAGGWTDSSGAENGDKCAWITPGTPGGSHDLTLSTGSFAVQTTWSNNGSHCAG